METFDKICRACMIESKQNETTHFIFEAPIENSTKSIAELLSTIPGLRLDINDELPKDVCMQCLDNLMKWSAFQEMCLQTQQKLLEQLLDTKVKARSIVRMELTSPDPLDFETTMLDYDNTVDSTGCLPKEEKDEIEAVIDYKPATEHLEDSSEENRDNTDTLEKDAKGNYTAGSIRANKDDEAGTDVAILKVQNNVCEYCTKDFSNPYRLREHIRVHTGEQPFNCLECGKGFKQNSNYRRHLQTHTDKKPYECLECPKEFNNLGDLYAHTKTHVTIEPYTCDECGATFLKRYQLKKHCLNHSQKSQQCEFCDKRFSLPEDLRAHRRIHSGEKPFKCEYCNSSFRLSSQHNKHLRLHLGEQIYQCTMCPQKFHLASGLRDHYEVHQNNDIKAEESNDLTIDEHLDVVITEEKIKDEMSVEMQETESDSETIAEKKRKCANLTKTQLQEENKDNDDQLDLVPKTLPLDSEAVTQETEVLNTNDSKKRRRTGSDHSRTDSKNSHVKIKRRKRQTVPKDHVCEYCKKVFQRQMALENHKRSHTNEPKYLCSECGKVFTHPTSLKTHLMRHSGERPFECPECPKTFRCLGDLSTHKLKHAKIKRHICDICGSGFVTPTELKTHKMRHMGEKPHKCSYCEKRFVASDHLRRHERTHTGEKPYKCEYCKMAYAQSNDLIKHLRVHLGENVYKCELCPQRFRMATIRREHFKSHKNEDKETRLNNLKALEEAEAELKATLTVPAKDLPEVPQEGAV